MSEDHKHKEPGSEEFTKFKSAMLKIVSVGKAEIVERLPKMFQERVGVTKKRASRKRPRQAKP